MSTSARTTWVPWGIALVCAVLAIAGWLRPGAVPVEHASDSSPREELTAEEDVAPETPSQLEALTECTTRLERLRTVVEIEGAPADVSEHWLAAADGGLPAAAAGCLAQPGVLAVATRVAEERRAEHRGAELRSVRRALSELLGIPTEDVDWMSDYVCAARALRRDGLAELRSAAEPSDELLEPLRTGRAALLEDVRDRIGEHRYAAFREIGGVGMLGEVVECDP